MVNYYFENDLFVIENYDKAKPLQAFQLLVYMEYQQVYYVNRGQVIAGFE